MRNFKFLILIRSIFGTESFSAPVIVFFYIRHIGISLSEYSLSLMLMFFMSAIMQVPTGIISDKFGRKKTLIMGEIIYSLMLFLLIFIPSLSLFYVSAIILPIASALSSGNLESLAYEALSEIGKEDEFRKIMKTSALISILGGAIAGIIGGFLAQKDIILPLLLDALIITFGAILSWKILPQDKTKNKNPQGPQIKDIIKTAIEFSKTSKDFLKITIKSAVLFACIRTLFTIYGPLLTDAGFKYSQVGIIIGFLTIASFSLIKIQQYFSAQINQDHGLELGMIILVIVSGILGFHHSFILVAILLQQILRVFSQFYSRYYINKAIPADHSSRVTILSFTFLVNLLMAGIFGAVESILIGICGAKFTFMTICLITGLILFLLLSKQKASLINSNYTLNKKTTTSLDCGCKLKTSASTN